MSSRTLNVLLQLFRRDMMSFRRSYIERLLDMMFLFFTNVIVFSYFMPKLGVGQDYGPLMMIAAIASFGLFDVIGRVHELMSDIAGDKNINYILTLPLPSFYALGYIALFWGFQNMLLTAPLFLFGKLLIPTKFFFRDVAWIKLVLMLITANLFYGILALWITGVMKKFEDLSKLFTRIVNPLFMFGTYFYTWHAAYALSPWVGIANLLCPVVYCIEGMRAAALGQSGFLPYWICFGVLWGLIFLLGTHGIHKLKKRLDCL
ncbi:MAG: hypothetical protein SP1CHLAM54_11600 [Chlamydiia bacterium]|nr:hypothetical protein [Chlamydiia bacterium]MCH9616063.1 hypothetical protein [Chlamydiia bacterium]MCH9629086.1 hypothetical protein [Chlamydiia bacterium]